MNREMIAFCFLLAQGGCENQLRGHAAGNFSVGNSKEKLSRAGKITAGCSGCEWYPSGVYSKSQGITGGGNEKGRVFHFLYVYTSGAGIERMCRQQEGFYYLFRSNSIFNQFFSATRYVKKISITISIAHTPKTDNKQGVPFITIQMPIIMIPPMIKEIPPICWLFFHVASFFMLQCVLNPIIEFIRNLGMRFPVTIINIPMMPKTS